MPFAERLHAAKRYHALLVAAAPLLACANTPSSETPPLLNTPIAEQTERELPTWSRFQELSTWASLSETPWKVNGHAPKPYSASLRVSPEARNQYLNLVTDSVLPSSSVIAELVLGADGRVEQILAMEKQANGSWEFLILSATGGARARGALDPCLRCHAEAPADFLFGPPR